MPSTRSGNSYFLPPSPAMEASKQPASERVKYILVTGGVCSSLGKGVTTSSIGALLRSQGYRVSSIKIDPYINVDAGLMSPYEHGEVYVLTDGGEVDLDLGNYERWMRVSLTRQHNITTGKVFERLITKERSGGFIGQTVTLVPHFTNEVVQHIARVSRIPSDGSGLQPQICLVELGGTIGDFESSPFVEALRTLRFTIPPEDFCLVHCTYLPVMGGSQKTKPTQHSCRNLLALGLSADFLVCRSETELEETTKKKLSQLCGMDAKYIIGAPNVKCLYEIPCLFHSQGIVEKLIHKMRLNEAFPSPIPPMNFPGLDAYRQFCSVLAAPEKTVTIAFVGKYTAHGTDTYFSVMQAFEHCSIQLRVGIKFLWIEATLLEPEFEDTTPEAYKATEEALYECDGIFVPGGFGDRGTNGKIRAIQIARERNIPYFGVCLGMQMLVLEYARNVLNIPLATSEEITKEAEDKLIVYMPPEVDVARMGANMRLGACDCHIVGDGKGIMSRIYGQGAKLVSERHRHRYEFNMKYRERIEKAGLCITGVSDPTFGAKCRVEAVELPTHPFFLGVQYHPEFISSPSDPSPPYLAFVAATAKIQYEWPTGLNSRAVETPSSSAAAQ